MKVDYVSSRSPKTAFGFLTSLLCALLLLGLLTAATPQASAQNNNNNNNNNDNDNNNNNNNNNDDDDDDDSDYDRDYYRWGYRSAIGGVKIDAGQVLRTATQQELRGMNAEILAKMEAIPANLDQPSEARKISLRRLNALLASCEESGATLPDSARYLGGMTAIEYVVAVPEENDIYLVGPAEPWTLSDAGAVVGRESGKPVLHLEDLIVAMRASNSETPELISVSIDPTQEAIARMANVGATVDVSNADALQAANVVAMGQMTVNFTGVPADSRMANVLAGADYRMKRVSLGFEEAAIKNFTSYFATVKRASAAYGQRFWLEPQYATLYRDADSLVWKVSASSVDVLTEREALSADGSRAASKTVDVAAEKFAKNMTKRYAELAKAEPIFAEAKNCMDVALVAALIYAQNLQGKANCDLAAMTGELATPSYGAATAVQSDSLVRKTSRSVVAVTGGVLINPWETVANDVKVDEKLNGFTVSFAGSNWIAD